ncbi:MAG: hypothetical protein AAFN81_06885 [Bacteroidota bacterium]
MFKKHHSIQYIFSRLGQKFFEYKHPDAPWLTQQAVLLLDHLIRPSDRGLEFGSGRSTKWFARRCHHLHSIEHHEGWFRKVDAEIASLTNVKYELKELSTNNPRLSPYVLVLEKIASNGIDFILVDGQCRDILCLSSIEKLRSGGLLILDNAERYVPNKYNIPESIGKDTDRMTENWREFLDQIQDWRRIWTSNGVTATLILFKP